MGPDDNCLKSYPSETARLWPAKKRNQIIANSHCTDWLDTWIKKTQLDTGSLSAIQRSQCITYPTFYPVFLVWTLPITDATQRISRITDHNITVDVELRKGMNRYNINIFYIVTFSYVNHELKLPGDSSYLHLLQRQTSGPQSVWGEKDNELWHQPRQDETPPDMDRLGLHSWNRWEFIVILMKVDLLFVFPFFTLWHEHHILTQIQIPTLLPIDDEVPSGFGGPDVIQSCPAVLQLQWYFGICRPHQLKLKVQWLL